jgi:hypothetical protein
VRDQTRLSALAVLVLFGECIAGYPTTSLPSASALATLAGQVVTNSPTPVPVHRATVRLARGDAATPRLAGTDEQGRFVFQGLLAGQYSLSVSKPGFVETFYGARRPGRGPAVPIAIADASRTDFTLVLLPGAAISGLVTDGFGRGVSFVTVAAVALSDPGRAPSLAETDDRGAYRVFGLAPGEYLIGALPRGKSSGRSSQAGDIRSVTEAEVQWALGSGLGRTPPRPGSSVAYAPVFFPGTVDAGSATPVPVQAGEDVAGIDFVLRVVPVSTLAGSILGPDGGPAPTATVSLQWRRRSHGASEALLDSGAVSLPRPLVRAPSFSVAGVWPGEYTLIASSRSGQRGAPAPDATGEGILWAVSDITVDGSDQTSIQLRLLPGLRLSGVYRFNGTPPIPKVDSFELTLEQGGLGTPGGGDVRAKLDSATGALSFTSVPPGRYVLRSTVGGPWFLESAVLDGLDLADRPLDVHAGGERRAGLVVTFSDRPAQIDGQLIDDAGAPVTRYSVILFPVDEEQWHPQSRRIRLARPATDGVFTMAGLPAGEYAIGAAEDVLLTDLDASLFRELLVVSHRLRLAPGEHQRQTLKTVR